MTSVPPTSETLYDLIRLVRPLYKTLEASVALELAPTGLSVSQRAILELVLDHGSLTVPALARHLIAPRQFIQRIVNELLAMGLVERQRNAAHKRSVLIALTPTGSAAIASVKQREAAVMEPIARDLDAADIETARAVMAAVTEAFRSHNERNKTTNQEDDHDSA
ncbi:MAG: MarR family transcriptional regulator [Pseudomonadota bacterium]